MITLTRLGTRNEPDFSSEPTEVWSSETATCVCTVWGLSATHEDAGPCTLCEASLPLMRTLGLAHCVRSLCHLWEHWALHTVWGLSATHENTEPCTLCEASLPLMRRLGLAHCAMHNSLNRADGGGFNPGREFFWLFFNVLQRPIDGEYCFSCFFNGNEYSSDWMWKDNSLFVWQ